jgi:glucose-6-phosphate isomerase
MHYRQIIDDMFERQVGARGLSDAAWRRELEACKPALDRLRQRHSDGSLPLLRLPAARADLAALQPPAQRLRREFDHVVILGTGGSSLGGQTLASLADLGFGPRAGAPRLWFMDNVDPATFEELFARLDMARTAVIAISKSGGTAETLAQLLVILDRMQRELGTGHVAQHLLAITEPGDNPLRRIAGRIGCPVLEHDPGIGGRYAALSLVGMLPAMVAGLDAAQVRAGAGTVLDQALGANEGGGSEPAIGAALSIALWRERGIATTVLMPYVDRLAHFGLWYRQLWAESLGKQGMGTTPIRAVGTVDQHSQLQLYLDGPADKMFTVLIADTACVGPRMPAALLDGDKGLAYLGERTLGDLILAEADATAATLAKAGRPVRLMRIGKLDEAVMGALMMHFFLETIIAADLLGIDAFDQPAVETGKVLTRQYLAERGA